jgi:maltose/moltooligosaccharide transporter
MEKKQLSFWQIWNMSFGFLGIQFGWGLQMANMSVIYRYLGAEESEIPILWLAAPLTGLIIQPIVGFYSDRTWGRFGRRHPYFFVGALLASLALIAMPNSSTLWMAAGLLWILDASVNISMEPFRAFVGDMLPQKQRKVGFAMQSLVIGAGAMAASAMPWILTNWVGLEPSGGDNGVPLSIHISFYTGAIVFFLAVLYTILKTKEYPPEDMEAFKKMQKETSGFLNIFKEIILGIKTMPRTMQRLAVVQFFTWIGLFCLFTYFTPSVATYIFNGTPPPVVKHVDASVVDVAPVVAAVTPEQEAAYRAFQEGTEWGGICFTTYNGVAFIFSFLLLWLVGKYSAKWIHFVCLGLGALGFLSIQFIENPQLLIISMIGVGIMWASVIAMPYAMLSNGIPEEKMGFYMGVFNFFIALPQIFTALALGSIVQIFFGGVGLYALTVGGISLVLAMLALLRVDAKY